LIQTQSEVSNDGLFVSAIGLVQWFPKGLSLFKRQAHLLHCGSLISWVKCKMITGKFNPIYPFIHITRYPGGIRSHDPQLQSPRWQAETIPLDFFLLLESFMEWLNLESIGDKKK
jgi:hypothetical protein